MVAASCRREGRLFLDQGVAGRERLRKALSVRVCKEYCSLERSFLLTYIHTCMDLCSSGSPEQRCIPCVCIPVYYPPITLFLPSPILFQQSVSLVTSSLPELTWCANVSTFRFICQSPELRPAPCVYLSLHKAVPSAVHFFNTLLF
ncbi:hypothetical protein ILYODFUR_030835 [Ilyodon furcidens]|uniref:Uncharacterized protein n=1 Tax=Ilyodon furcidens TaxID=33524 RepID=A0ABV0T407_9TELE